MAPTVASVVHGPTSGSGGGTIEVRHHFGPASARLPGAFCVANGKSTRCRMPANWPVVALERSTIVTLTL